MGRDGTQPTLCPQKQMDWQHTSFSCLFLALLRFLTHAMDINHCQNCVYFLLTFQLFGLAGNSEDF